MIIKKLLIFLEKIVYKIKRVTNVTLLYFAQSKNYLMATPLSLTLIPVSSAC